MNNNIKEIQLHGKAIVLSDIHYPYCNMREINEIIRKESPEIIILLGDIITENENDIDKFFSNVNFPRDKIIYIQGDDDKVIADTEILRIANLNITLVHGHQFFSENTQYSFAKLLKKVSRDIPPFLFCQVARLFLRTKDFLVLGHSHALVQFPYCINAGTLSLLENLYSDRGYAIIENKRGRKMIKTIKILS